MLKVVSVTPSVSRIGIPFSDLDSVKGALVAFSQGASRSSGTARQKLLSGFSDDGALTVMMHDLLVGNPGRFLERMFAEMDERFESGFSFDKSYDYDGDGPFRKASVTVNKVKADGTFVLNLHAAYVGRQVENDLAEALGIQQSLNGSSVNVTYDHTVKGDFVIDFGPIANALTRYTANELTGSMIADVIAAGRSEEYSTLVMDGGVYTLLHGSEFSPSASISIDSMSVDRYYDHPFVAEGSVVRGAMRPDWDDKSKMRPPVVSISVNGQHAEKAVSWQHLPILDPQVEAEVLKLNSSITGSLVSLVTT
jgi:hypothetical protein